MQFAGLARPISDLHGLGPAAVRRFARLGVATVSDLLCLRPRRYQDRRSVKSLVAALEAGEGLVEVEVASAVHIGRGKRRGLRLDVQDQSSRAELLLFGPGRTAPSPDTKLRLWVTLRLRGGVLRIGSHEHARPQDDGRLVPVYPLTEGLSQNRVRDAVAAALAQIDLNDPIQRHLHDVHAPATPEAAENARAALALVELRGFQIGLARSSSDRSSKTRPAVTRTIVPELIAALPFELTGGQRAAFDQIRADLDGPTPMARLLQGDVGAGKTVPALLAAAIVAERGEQSVLLAPTDVLARQHMATIERLGFDRQLTTVLLTGSIGAAQRAQALAEIHSGTADVVVATHAAFSADVSYRALGLVVIDEQHRFGVRQRAAMLAKGDRPDLLLMSATPIPRSLALIAYGDLEISTIVDRPAGRKPIETHLVKMGNERRVYEFVRSRLASGERAYFVYPEIDPGGARRSAAQMHERLAHELAPHRVVMAHSRMPEDERTVAMDDFSAGRAAVLVATTVVEVGIDVPEATCMIVEHADEFGLATLHQLRGRVGRSARESYCFLVFAEPVSETARERLKVMYTSNDGFFIAEEDLRIRGPGELDGTRQSGWLRFAFAELPRDITLLASAREEVRRALEHDPDLTAPEHTALAQAVQVRDRPASLPEAVDAH